MSSREKSPYYGSLQQVVDSLFADLTEEERIADMAGVPGARGAQARCDSGGRGSRSTR